MAITFNAEEIYTMAEQIERNGADFYRKAAEGASDEEIAQMLLDLAAMEDEHERTFSQMKAALADDERVATAFDPENEGALPPGRPTSSPGPRAPPRSSERPSTWRRTRSSSTSR
jgi:rubrerythrin